MEIVNEINLPTSDFQGVDELSIEELEAVAGGDLWGDICHTADQIGHAINEGYRDFTQGASDGLNGKSSHESNNNYGTGYVVGSAWRTKW